VILVGHREASFQILDTTSDDPPLSPSRAIMIMEAFVNAR
jgi:hypothetical protein